VLILDEATSALDPDNEALVRRAIAGLHGNLTVVMIGHRLADLDQVDQIITVEKGKVTSQRVQKVAA
jgi:ATP-binding cassette subfamily C protein